MQPFVILQDTTDTANVIKQELKIKKIKFFPVCSDSFSKPVIDPFLVDDSININQINTFSYFDKYYYQKYVFSTKEGEKKSFNITRILSPAENQSDNTSDVYFRGNYDWLAGVLLFLFILLAFIRVYYGKVLIQTFRSVFNLQASYKLFSEKSGLVQNASFLMTINYLLCTGLFLFELLDFFHISLRFDISGFGLFLLCTAFVSFFYAIRMSIYWFTATMVGAKTGILEVLSSFNIYFRAVSIIILPVITAIPYVPENISLILVYCGIAIFLTSFVLRLIRGFILSFKTKLSLFYSFLYFCMLEIIPVLYVFIYLKK